MCEAVSTVQDNKENNINKANTQQDYLEILNDTKNPRPTAYSPITHDADQSNEANTQRNCSKILNDADSPRPNTSCLHEVRPDEPNTEQQHCAEISNDSVNPTPSSSISNNEESSRNVSFAGRSTTSLMRPRITVLNSSDEDGDFDSDDSVKDPNFNTSSSSSSSSSSSLSSTSSSSSDSEDESHHPINGETSNRETPIPENNINENQERPKKTRKRSAEPQQWKQNQIKRLRNLGMSYKTRHDKTIRAKECQPACNDRCRLKCSSFMTEEKRKELLTHYWALGDIEKQRLFIDKHIKKITVKYRYTTTPTGRGNNHAFYFEIDGKLRRICKKMFRSTLDINDRIIRTVIAKAREEGFLEEDMRGKHRNHKAVDTSIKDGVRDHIQSIPRIESHYLRQQTSREFISGGKTLTDLHKDYMQQFRDANLPFANLVMYSRIFNSEFNLGFFVPKKDRCELCVAFENATGDDKTKLETKFEQHLIEKRLSREEKGQEKDKVSQNYIVAVYDLQAVLQVPRGDVSLFYYKSKLNNLNLTITKLRKPDDNNSKKRGTTNDSNDSTDCYFWHEGEGNRGSDEIGSCLLAFIEKETQREHTEPIDFVYFSDKCCGQNKNRFIVALYMFAIMKFANVNSITHKFLITGHTQNEGDSVHSIIEKQIKRSLKSGPIYVPNQYALIIRDAKKTGNPLKVHELSHEDFISLKCLADDIGLKSLKRVKITEIKVLQFSKDNPTVMKYKLSYSDENISEVKLITRRCDSPQLKPAHSSKLKIKDNKKADLISLVKSNHIPHCHADFYYNL
ncbi:unnamed protein product [Phaedon cochleariae]|uniref:DUF7869 domain-containing protein n=1 Tax=Phaedon cochleariae TaxID=80249 RepID=A0A9N9X5S7_PHACE|nr:unnamed protein product [Phaedon cochleariae]